MTDTTNSNAIIAANEAAAAQVAPATEHPYAPLKAAMTEAGILLSEGEGFLVHEFHVVRDFLHSKGMQHIGDEWHLFSHYIAQGAHSAWRFVQAEAPVVIHEVEHLYDELTGRKIDTVPATPAPVLVPAPTPTPEPTVMSFDGQSLPTTFTNADPVVAQEPQHALDEGSEEGLSAEEEDALEAKNEAEANAAEAAAEVEAEAAKKAADDAAAADASKKE